MHLILFEVAVTSVYYVTIMTTHMSLTSKWNECHSMYYIGLNNKQKFGWNFVWMVVPTVDGAFPMQFCCDADASFVDIPCL